MAAYYRLTDINSIGALGFRLAEGVQILPAEAFSPVSEATRLIAQAQAQAQTIVEDAERVREEERRRGFAEGLTQGRLEAIEQALREARNLDGRLEALEQDIADIVMVSMRKLIDSYDDAARAEAVVRGALKQMRREKKAEIRIAPEHFPRLRGMVDGILKDFPGFELIEVIEDATLSGSSVVVETAVGRVEGDIGARLDELAAIVRGLLPGGPTDTDDRPEELMHDEADDDIRHTDAPRVSAPYPAGRHGAAPAYQHWSAEDDSDPETGMASGMEPDIDIDMDIDVDDDGMDGDMHDGADTFPATTDEAEDDER